MTRPEASSKDGRERRGTRPGSLTCVVCFPPLSFRLYGFKIHPMAYQLQLQAASSFKSPVKAIR